jgi:hypothetical protein
VPGTGDLRLVGVHDNHSNSNNDNDNDNAYYYPVSSVMFKIGSYLYLKMLVGSVGGIVTHSPKYYPYKNNH